MRSQNESLSEPIEKKEVFYKVKSCGAFPQKRQDDESFTAYKSRMQRERQILKRRLRGFRVFNSKADHADKYGNYGLTYRKSIDGELPKMKII